MFFSNNLPFLGPVILKNFVLTLLRNNRGANSVCLLKGRSFFKRDFSTGIEAQENTALHQHTFLSVPFLSGVMLISSSLFSFFFFVYLKVKPYFIFVKLYNIKMSQTTTFKLSWSLGSFNVDTMAEKTSFQNEFIFFFKTLSSLFQFAVKCQMQANFPE